MRARLFLRDGKTYRLAAELSVSDADEVWRQVAADPSIAGRPLAAGDIVYLGDLYVELDGDGGWRRLEPSDLTQKLYRLVSNSSSG